MMKNIPNFVIGGAPKCATSTIFSWLCDHPEVTGSSKKETFFLMDQEHPQLNQDNNIYKSGLEGYSTYFEHAPNESKYLIEGTTQYLYQKKPISFFLEHNPDCKFLFVFRDPIKRIHSSYEYARNNLASIDQSVSFKEFVEACQQKTNVKGIKGVNELLPYELDYGNYASYLENWKPFIDRGQVKLMVFENLAKSPYDHMIELSEFLGIDASFYLNYSFEKKNVSVGIKNQTVHRISKKVAGLIPLKNVKRVLKSAYYKLQSKPTTKSEDVDDQYTLEFLNEYYKEEVSTLKEKYNLDISLWQCK